MLKKYNVLLSGFSPVKHAHRNNDYFDAVKSELNLGLLLLIIS